jgi:hypothetical protein
VDPLRPDISYHPRKSQDPRETARRYIRAITRMDDPYWECYYGIHSLDRAFERYSMTRCISSMDSARRDSPDHVSTPDIYLL